jgi:hypothetical protein
VMMGIGLLFLEGFIRGVLAESETYVRITGT